MIIRHSLSNMSSSPPKELTEDLVDYGDNERKNINKEKTRNHNQPYAFLNQDSLAESMGLHIFPGTIGSGSKGGMAFDNKTINYETKVTKEAKEIKIVSLVGTKECKRCLNKAPPFQPKCVYCNNSEFNDKSDSRASISSGAHINFRHIINEYIIFVQDYCDDKKIITIKGYKFLTSNQYFNNYIQNQYDSGNKKGGTANFVPYSYDWFLAGPISILDVFIDISTDKTIITYNLYKPNNEIYDEIDYDEIKNVLRIDELSKIDNEYIINGYLDYEYTVSLYNLRNKSIGKKRGNVTRK